MKPRTAAAITRSRLALCRDIRLPRRRTLEGGCGVIGIVGTEALAGRSIIRACAQMRNRGNGKGGGVAAVGLFDEAYRRHYALHVAYLDEQARGAVERDLVAPLFDIAHAEPLPSVDDHRAVGLAVRPPLVWRYFVRGRFDAIDRFAGEHGIDDASAAEDELVFQNSFRLNHRYYASSRQPRAFVLSHGRDTMILKGVGYAEEIARYYLLEEQRAQLWIGHQRYPTRGRVWHPGGAHPFAGLHEALVHNGDFANYHACAEYLRQRGLIPLFVTDTEVSVLLFDLYARVLRYPLEYVVEALAPTPEGDFERLSKRRQRIYRALQTAHLRGSPDGPWFFIVARADPEGGGAQLIGITDVSMLRPQVFALQRIGDGGAAFGAIASEKQAIDAFFEDLAAERADVAPVADRYWAARGGSCTDGGAFVFTVRDGALDVRDKFGDEVGTAPAPAAERRPLVRACGSGPDRLHAVLAASFEGPLHPDEQRIDAARATEAVEASARRAEAPPAGIELELRRRLADGDLPGFTAACRAARDRGWIDALERLSALRDRPWDPGVRRRAELLAAIDHALVELLDSLPGPGSAPGPVVRLDRAAAAEGRAVPEPPGADAEALVIDARGFAPEGPAAVSRLLVTAHRAGWRRLVVYRCQGDRFLGCGLGPRSDGTRIDVYGSSGDYLGSGLDGATICVHGDAQDQVGQILNAGRIVVYGSVGQTLLYGAKGGDVFVRDSAAGRPLINAVGEIRAVINGTCLDYCAESFMAGEQLGGGFVIINGLAFDGRGEVLGLELKYPGNNLFSLASGGACYLNDPYRTVTSAQLNGAAFVEFRQADWHVIRPYLQQNQQLFGISIRHDLLKVDGVLKWPKEVFRKVVASSETAGLDWSSLTT